MTSFAFFVRHWGLESKAGCRLGGCQACFCRGWRLPVVACWLAVKEEGFCDSLAVIFFRKPPSLPSSSSWRSSQPPPRSGVPGWLQRAGRWGWPGRSFRRLKKLKNLIFNSNILTLRFIFLFNSNNSYSNKLSLSFSFFP